MTLGQFVPGNTKQPLYKQCCDEVEVLWFLYNMGNSECYACISSVLFIPCCEENSYFCGTLLKSYSLI